MKTLVGLKLRHCGVLCVCLVLLNNLDLGISLIKSISINNAALRLDAVGYCASVYESI